MWIKKQKGETQWVCLSMDFVLVEWVLFAWNR